MILPNSKNERQGGRRMVRLDMDRNCVRVYEDSTVIGSIELYDNLYHMRNQYLKMDDFT